MLKNILLFISILSVSSTALSETTIPNVFSTGDDIVAAEMNANFDAGKLGINANEVALEALVARVEALEQSATVSFEGTYDLSVMEFVLDSCGGAPQINHRKSTGTATSSGGVVSFSTNQQRFTLRNGHLDNSTSEISGEIVNENFELMIDGTGAFVDAGIDGRMSEDGSMFVITNSGEEAEDCNSATIAQFIGVRVSQ